MKWLMRLTGHAKAKTPMPPKPYVDVASTGRHMVDPRFYDMNDLAHIDAEKPHWDDGRFEPREKVPFFDFFGFNRNWSWSLFKLMGVIFPVMFYYEARLVWSDPSMKITSDGGVVAPPAYSHDMKATEDELRSAGFAFVGAKALDHLEGMRKKDTK